MLTILDYLRKGNEYLTKHKIPESRLNVEILLSNLLKIDRVELYLRFDEILDSKIVASLRDHLIKRAKGVPIQYILGEVEFCDIKFKIDSRSLIPRPETQELALFLSDYKKNQNFVNSKKPIDVLDLACGSGVIGLYLYTIFNNIGKFILSDISQKALDLSKENYEYIKHNLHSKLFENNNISFLKSDLFSSIEGKFDLIVSNPPYISINDKDNLSKEVLNEPHLALFGGEKGVEIIDKILTEGQYFLKDEGTIAIEFGFNQGAYIRELAEKLNYKNISIILDIDGKERFIIAQKPS